jgi:hypothetical protein
MEQIYAGIDAVIENMGDLISKYRAVVYYLLGCTSKGECISLIDFYNRKKRLRGRFCSVSYET